MSEGLKMNWIRDNIVKIIIILIVAVLVIVFAVACSGDDDDEIGTESATGYIELENKLQNAAYKYVKKNQKLLPKTTEKSVKIKLDTLINNRYIKEIHAIENSSVVCSGYVEITKKFEDKSDYRYTPYIKCGKYYETKTIGEYIKSNEAIVKDGDGLYLLSENSDGSSYFYRGENPNNYIILDERPYRILEVDENNYLKLIAMKKTSRSYKWDDRYNSSINKTNTYGINDYSLSRIKDTLELLYESESSDDEVYFTEKEKGYIVEKDFCVGKRSSSDTAINKISECKDTNSQKVGLITVSEYYRISTSTGCTEVGKLDCNNYNYLHGYSSNKFVTLTASADNTYSYYLIDNSAYEEYRCNRGYGLYPVIYINNNILYKSGSGTKADPYIVR